MDDFNSLESLYTHLEDNASDYRCRHSIGDLFQKLRDSFKKKGEAAKANLAQQEIDFFSFRLEKGEALPMWEMPDQNGKLVRFPSYHNFSDDEYKYLIKRFENGRNPVLKARYAHILWCSPKKHAKYAKAAVDAYLELINVYEQKDKDNPREHFGRNVLDVVKNAYSLSYQVKYRSEQLKSEIKRLILKFNFESCSAFALRASLIRLMLEARRRFSKADFTGFQDICWKTALALSEANNIHGAIKMVNLGERIDEKLGTKTHEWILKRAQSYELLMSRRKKGDLAIPDFCLRAIEEYKKAGKKGKVSELEKKYVEVKSSGKLQEFGAEIDVTETVQKYKHFANQLAEKGPDVIIGFLMYNKSVLPTRKALKKEVEEQNREYVFRRLAGVSVIDNRGHQAEHFSTEEREAYDILEQYLRSIQVEKSVLIDAIFQVAIGQNKLSAEDLLNFLAEHSWFGKSLPRTSPTGERIEYNWLSLIAPALNEYFVQMDRYFINPANQPSFVLSIDSLTLKIEGLVRDLCKICGVSTFYQTRDSKGRNIVREKDIHALLYEDKVRQLFDEDELLFFRFLLVEKAGYNLRHKVAHALMHFHEYSGMYMYLLIIALLKLGKYDLVRKTDQIVGNRRQKIFHRNTCKYTKKLGTKSKLRFGSREMALKNGYRPCNVCRP